ncbi:MAG: class I SAM-dependent methyltransferase, partial [Chloroflexota bacterium]|nr:class I SAM-dependent methyltransferase [Chloroflexota bacterium]
MPINFHAQDNRFTYAKRRADPSWRTMVEGIVNVEGKHVVEIGCGGGIYVQALADMGAASVTGVDFSEEMLKVARQEAWGYATVQFVHADACKTGLGDETYDVVLQRALIHHLPQARWPSCFAEARRLLKPGGVLIVQNRTLGDCLLPGSATHIRGYFFERYPKLKDVEVGRRPENRVVRETLEQVGFVHIEEHTLWEMVQKYPNFQGLRESLLARSGSVLHELTDAELTDLVAYIQRKMQEGEQGEGQEVVRQDRWTLW